MQFSKFLLLVGSFALVDAHFLLNYPPTRGFDEDKEPSICGGFSLSNNRSQFPLSGGIVSITSEHPKSDIDILISFEANPTTFGNFNQTSSGTSIPFLMPFTQMNAQGDACFPVNVSSLGVSQAQNGANATIMVQFNGGDGQLYQCADVTLSNSVSVPAGTKCANATGAFPSSTAPSTTTSSSSGATASPNGVTAILAPMVVTVGVGSVAAVLALQL